MYKFLVSYGNKETVVKAKDLYSAKTKGAKELNVPASKHWQIDIRLIKMDEVVVNTADL